MEDKFKQIECGDNDVLSFPGDVTFKVGKFTTSMNKTCVSSFERNFNDLLNHHGIQLTQSYSIEQWLNQGINCEILNLGEKKWKKGKVKIKVSVEFYAEDEEILETPQINQSESPLDDLRQKINQATQ